MKTTRLTAVESFLLILLYSDKLLTVNSSPTCKWDQITRLNGSVESCWDCPRCPEGSGLTPQCSSYVGMDVSIQCEECKDGIGFSDVNDISSCKPCTICGDNEETIRPCNKTHNAICGKCKKGFYREITEDCWPCTKCCPDSTSDDLEPKCLQQGLSPGRSCRLNFKTEQCANQPTPENTKKVISNDSIHGRVMVNNSTVIVRYHIIIKQDQNMWILIGAGVFVCLMIGVTVYAFKNCRQSRKKPSSEQEMGLCAQPTNV